MRSYGYQYETSPRKIKPDYTVNKKRTNTTSNKKNITKKSSSAKTKKSNTKQTVTKNKSQKNNKSTSKVNNTKMKFSIFVKCVLIFLVFFMIIYRNSLISQSFAKIQSLKTSITELQKENNQLEINIQNSLNTNNIEQAAKEILGMQKLTNKQIVYINIDKKDYVEPRAEEVVINEDTNFIEKILEKIKGVF